MKTPPLVSIIIPCYQQQELLLGALDSIESQNFERLEVIIVDDGCEPKIELPKVNYSFEIKLVRQKNKGLSAARNFGISHVHAQAVWVKFLDADDALLANCISSQVSSLPDPSGESAHVSMIGFVEEKENDLRKSTYPSVGNPQEAILLVNIAPVHSFLYPLRLLSKH